MNPPKQTYKTQIVENFMARIKNSAKVKVDLNLIKIGLTRHLPLTIEIKARQRHLGTVPNRPANIG